MGLCIGWNRSITYSHFILIWNEANRPQQSWLGFIGTKSSPLQIRGTAKRGKKMRLIGFYSPLNELTSSSEKFAGNFCCEWNLGTVGKIPQFERTWKGVQLDAWRTARVFTTQRRSKSPQVSCVEFLFSRERFLVLFSFVKCFAVSQVLVERVQMRPIGHPHGNQLILAPQPCTLCRNGETIPNKHQWNRT